MWRRPRNEKTKRMQRNAYEETGKKATQQTGEGITIGTPAGARLGSARLVDRPGVGLVHCNMVADEHADACTHARTHDRQHDSMKHAARRMRHAPCSTHYHTDALSHRRTDAQTHTHGATRRTDSTQVKPIEERAELRVEPLHARQSIRRLPPAVGATPSALAVGAQPTVDPVCR